MGSWEISEKGVSDLIRPEGHWHLGVKEGLGVGAGMRVEVGPPVGAPCHGPREPWGSSD